jgi:transcriptional/translational regulatory protein YebC/TACO1
MGILNFPPGTPEEAIMEIALEAGADDVVEEADDSIEVQTSPEAFDAVLAAMEAAGFEPANSEITMRASTEVELDVESGQKVLRLLDVLEDLDDTQDVYSNADIPDEAYED